MTNLERPSPEALLQKFTKANQGQLTIFLGAAAGVGKTYAMLKALQQQLDDQVDAVIGYVEVHNRAETRALLPVKIETIPLKSIVHKGHHLQELDVDAILERKPRLVVIDELAHTNCLGSRNSKRFQDVLEIINAGIDVYTALNIQHIESLNDIISQITGVKVKETVPDYVVENADEIKLIDVTPDELIERLRDGKIYAPERASKALENFFRKGNLTALRELALLKTARKVEQQVKEYRADNAIDQVWASHDNLLVVLEPGYSSEKIIRSGKTMAAKGFSQWFVVYIDNNDVASKPLREREKLVQLLDLAAELGAVVDHLSGPNPAAALVAFARERNISTIVLSQYRLSVYYRLFGKSLLAQIAELAPEINLHLINDELVSAPQPKIANPTRKRSRPDNATLARKFVLNLLLFAVLGVALLPLGQHLAHENIIMLYLLAIIVFNRGRGTHSAIIAAFLATLSYDFYFVPPLFSFAVSDFQYVITFLIMAGVGIAFSVVTGNLRFQLSVLRTTDQKLRLLYECSRKLAEALVEQQVVEICQEFGPQIFKARYALLIPDLAEKLQPVTNQVAEQIDLDRAQWVFENGQAAGLNTNTFASSSLYYWPINSLIRTRGVLALLPDEKLGFFLPAEQDLIANFVSNLATTLERIHFTQIAIKTEVMLATNHNN